MQLRASWLDVNAVGGQTLCHQVLARNSWLPYARRAKIRKLGGRDGGNYAKQGNGLGSMSRECNTHVLQAAEGTGAAVTTVAYANAATVSTK